MKLLEIKTKEQREKKKEISQIEKSEKYKRIVDIRIRSFITACDRITKLSNKNFFNYDDDDISHLFYIIDEEVELIKTKFLRNGK